MEEFKSNSYKSRDPIKKTDQEVEKREKIITGSAKVVKKSGFERFLDTLKDAGKRVINDIVIPAAKKSLSDGINNMTDIMIYGEPQHRGTTTVGRTVSYRSYYDSRDRDRRSEVVSRQSRVAARDYDDIILETRGEADAVLNEMTETIGKYDYVKVADLYDLVGLSHSYTDNNYGWDDLRDAYVERVPDGYRLRLPRPMSIDR